MLIPFLLDQVGGVDDMIQADGLHPNEKAQPIILTNVWGQLRKLLDVQKVSLENTQL